MITSYTKNTYKSLMIGVAFTMLLGCTALTNASTVEQGADGIEIASETEEVRIEYLTTVWANALKSRDGRPRYDMMSTQAKEKFVQEQINRSGENWNYNIGNSSPWVVDFEIEIEGMTAIITYVTETSEPSYYKTSEFLTFTEQNGELIVDDYQTIFEGELIETTALRKE